MKNLLIYRNFEHEKLILNMYRLTQEYMNPDITEENSVLYTDCVNEMLEMASKYGLEGNLWHSAVAYILANAENAYSRASEKKGTVQGSISKLAEYDFAIFRELFCFDLNKFDSCFNCTFAPILECYVNSNTNGHVFNKRIRDRITRLGEELSATADAAGFMECMACFYKEYGVGKLGLHKAFRIGNDAQGNVVIVPITCTEHANLNQLVGYERQKQKLIENTESFVKGQKANNCLLYGDAGTGKSSSIKGIMDEYYEDGLRLIEVYKHQFKDLPAVINQIKGRNYKFIIYMDDLSFEEFEIEYKYLKAVIEGGLEAKPDNVLIYATSNRRHLIKETSLDSKDYNNELHSSDTVQEKTSLVARFGVTIYFGAPDKDEFEEIVVQLAQREGISMDRQKLLLLANQWELSHGGRSGRLAKQFIIHLKNQCMKEEK